MYKVNGNFLQEAFTLCSKIPMSYAVERSFEHNSTEQFAKNV